MTYHEALKKMVDNILLANNQARIDQFSEALTFVMEQFGSKQEQMNTPYFLSKLKHSQGGKHCLQHLTPIKVSSKIERAQDN